MKDKSCGGVQMNKALRIVLALACYGIVLGVCNLLWGWTVAGIVTGSIFTIDVALCVKSGVWRYYFSK